MYGGYAGLNFNFHSPNFKVPGLNGQFNSPIFPDDTTLFNQNSTSLSLAFGGMIAFPINDQFTVSGRLGVNFMGAKLTTGGRFIKALSPPFVQYTLTEHTFDASLTNLEFSPVLHINNLFSNIPIYLAGGLEIGIPLSATYTQSEIVTDTGATFPNPAGTRSRTYTTDADIVDKAVRLGIILGAGYEYRLNSSTILAPEITLRLPLTNVSSNSNYTTWSVPQLRIGINILFSGKSEPLPVTSTLKTGLESGYYTSEGTYTPLSSIKVEDAQYAELYPFIPYIFYANNSATPDSVSQDYTGRSERGNFTLATLSQDAIEVNRHTLDVVGYRMSQNPTSALTIVGSNDGKGETKNKKLSEERANFAKDYLVKSFGIAADRITVEARDLPEKASATSVSDGDAENRRVELKSTNRELFEPIMMKSDEQRIATPDLIEFKPKAESNSSIISWSLSLSQAGRILRDFVGIGDPPPQRWLIRPNELSNSQVPVDYKFTAADSLGGKQETNGSIPVEYISSTRKRTEQLADRTISKFSLVLFDFNKSEITPDNDKIIETAVIPSIQYNSTVKIYGYTDRIGDDAYNKKLSKERAESVRKALESKIKEAKYETYGNGEGVPIFDNNLPIGRHLSRTVQIYVETPRK
ncbi:MAG: OmpA family protein [Ignavibacteria bacterium]|nr:OmpA family protein [Ignavibacteria bacterium]